MKTAVLLVYAYLVCFVAIVCSAIFAGILLYDVVQAGFPEFTLSEHVKSSHSSNESFLEQHRTRSADGLASTYGDRSDAEVTAIREEKYRELVRAERNGALKSVIRSAIVLLISSLLFFLHWRMAQRVREA